MFTGLVEEVGRIRSVEPQGEGRRIRIDASRVVSDAKLGDSIAVDGACQTVVDLDEEGFAVVAVGTTLGRTTLGDFRPGRRVNLERAIAAGDRLGGHLVQGHVDATGRVERIHRLEERVEIDVHVPAEILSTTVLHGSVTINGISLTVNAFPGPGALQLSIIPHTWDCTNLPDLREGHAVNLEADLIGKYVRRLLSDPVEGPRLREGWTPRT